MVDIRNPAGKDACWISRLKGELIMEGLTSELLAASLSSLFLSSLISSCTRENAATSFFFKDADVRLASRWTHRSSSALWPSRSNTLRDDFDAPPVCSFFYDLCGATDLGGRPDTVPL